MLGKDFSGGAKGPVPPAAVVNGLISSYAKSESRDSQLSSKAFVNTEHDCIRSEHSLTTRVSLMFRGDFSLRPRSARKSLFLFRLSPSDQNNIVYLSVAGRLENF